ncbi:hypothetical protein ACGFMK_18170 [Amycolatopsis sp. NPDC049252]|uniref:hypothetical protein n=1 Tax=Amycolatopsis sp. NPDC049252 TaxID=3363933 RepID=UPI00371535F4
MTAPRRRRRRRTGRLHADALLLLRDLAKETAPFAPRRGTATNGTETDFFAVKK